MRKKWLTAGIGLGVGAAMLLVSGFTAMANTSGYETYKEALKNTKAESSLTANVDLTVTDNGTKVIAGTANIKLNQELNAGSTEANFDIASQTLSLDVFRQDGKVIFKSGDSEVYRVMEQNAAKWQHEGVAPNPPKAVENVFDALMGNIREHATVEMESDGGKRAALHLSGSQIPAVVNALGALAVSKSGDCDGWDDEQSGLDFNENMPKLADNVKVEAINLDARISPDNLLDWQTAEITVSGTDDSGMFHVRVIRLRIDFSDFSQTTPDQIDLSGKQTEEIRQDGMKRGWHQEGMS